jgi:hypothetical protein
VSTTLVKLVPKFPPGFVDTGGKIDAGIIDTIGNFAPCVVDTSGKFATSVVDTGGAPSLAKIVTVLTGYSGAGGKLIHEKTRSKRSRDTVPLIQLMC